MHDNIYKIFDCRSVYDIEDVEDHERQNLNTFFESNYGFKYKDIHSTAFNNQLKIAITETSNATDIVVQMARRALRCKKYPKWHEVIEYDC